MKKINGIIMQYFEWYLNCNGQLWNQIIKEAEKLGFKKCIIPESNKKSLKEKYKLDIIGVKDINEAMNKLGLK